MSVVWAQLVAARFHVADTSEMTWNLLQSLFFR